MAEQKNVLVIDDDPDFLDYMRIVLSANDYNVTTATTAHDGMDAMRQAAPDLVIVDVMMSYVLDGWSVTREMAYDPTLRDIPVMMVSAIVSSEDDSLFPDSEGGRIDAFMSKPLEPAMLLERMKQLLANNKREAKGTT